MQFLRCAAAGLLAYFCADAAHGSESATEVVKNRSPLGPNRFYPLPLTSIRPRGWLERQLRIQAAGLSGHLDELRITAFPILSQ
jgi:hypothetical protein